MVSTDIATPDPATKAPRKGLLATVLTSVVPLGGILLSPIFLVAAAMSFDAGESPAAWTVAIISICIPISCLVLLIVGWVLFAVRRPTGALIAMLAPLAWVVVIVVLFAVVMPFLR
ncbi:MAG TPA: hypothetical protein VHW60_04780 [Caulobacteraceae bacterium]|jgi:Kef-type K+ transport system membrane component KefB|nr:hypothetical protein [Caulobacteraceae bacterium]